MKKNVFSKVMALCLALVLCMGMMVGCGSKQLTAKELFDLSVNNQKNELNDGVITMYANSVDTFSAAEGTTVDVKVGLGDAAKELLASAAGGAIKFDWLSDIGLKFGTKLDKGVSSSQIGISLNGTDITTVNAVLDTESEKAYFAVPDLFSDALSLDVKSIMQEAAGSFPVDLKAMTDVKSWLPDQAALKSLVEKYTKIFLENITEVTKEESAVKGGGLSQKCNKLATTITAEVMKKIMKAFADSIEKDTELAGVLDKLGKVMGFTSSEVVPEIVENLRATDNIEGSLDLVLYTDDKGNTVGMEATGKNPESGDEDLMVMKFSAPEEDGKTALDAEFSNGSQKILISGVGTKSNNSSEGTYVVTADTVEICSIEVKNNDLEKAKKGIINGSYTIKFGKALTDMMSSNPLTSVLTQFSLKVDVAQTDAKNSKCSIALVDNSGSKFVSFDVDTKNGWSGDASIATDKAIDATDSSAVTGIISKIDFNGLAEKLTKAGVPSELTQYLAMIPYLAGGAG